MSTSIHTFLRKLESDNNIKHEKKEKVKSLLGNLPARTPTYPYKSIGHMEATTYSLDPRELEFCVFTNVPRRAINDRLEDRRIGRKKAYPDVGLIIIKIPSAMHEAASRWLLFSLVRKLTLMGIDVMDKLAAMETAVHDHQEPDQAFGPSRQRTTKANWPSLVFEVSWSESLKKLHEDATGWIERSKGTVRISIAMKVSRTRITIMRYKVGADQQTIVIQKPRWNQRNRETQVTGEPLIIQLEDLFNRTPEQGQDGIVYTRDDLLTCAELVWQTFPPQ